MLAAPDQYVAKIERHGGVPDPHLAGAWLRQRHVLEAEHLGPAVPVETECLHRVSLRDSDRTNATGEKEVVERLRLDIAPGSMTANHQGERPWPGQGRKSGRGRRKRTNGTAGAGQSQRTEGPA